MTMNLRFQHLLLVALALVCGCDSGPRSEPGRPGERVFETRGVVRDIAPSRQTAVIRHEEIPGYMPRMVMELIVRDTNDLVGIRVGDEITFRLHATDDTHWIDTLRRVGQAQPETEKSEPRFAVGPGAELHPGDEVPDATFLSEAGVPVRLSDFRGRALAFTFFFTRCPLPDYCPRMNRHFSAARELLLQRADAPTNWQFLCVSFDAEFDQPAVLARYARMFRGNDANRWLFAAAAPEALVELAPRLDLQVTREEGSFAHNLRTVVLDPQGRIHRQFDGNDWTPQELADALVDAAVQTAAAPTP
jgi:protein SCO1/2